MDKKASFAFLQWTVRHENHRCEMHIVVLMAKLRNRDQNVQRLPERLPISLPLFTDLMPRLTERVLKKKSPNKPKYLQSRVPLP